MDQYIHVYIFLDVCAYVYERRPEVNVRYLSVSFSLNFGVKPFTELELTDLATLGDLQALGIL